MVVGHVSEILFGVRNHAMYGFGGRGQRLQFSEYDIPGFKYLLISGLGGVRWVAHDWPCAYERVGWV